MSESKDKSSYKIIAAILVAAMSAYSTYMSTHASNKSDENKQANLQQINTLVIPQIKKEIEEGEQSNKELAKDVLVNRERLARLEGIVESLPARLVRDSLRHAPKPLQRHSSLRKAASKQVEVVIPNLEQNYLQKPLTEGD